MRIIILTLSFLFFSAFANADVEQSAFMKAFHECVANYSGEELDDETLGVAESALMNGEFINGDIDSGYFSFMDCITPAAVSSPSVNLDVNASCPHSDYTVTAFETDILVQLPYKRDGESVQIKGMEFECRSGAWRFVSALDNNGIDQDCDSQVISESSCSYILPTTKHAGVATAFNSLAGSDGFYRAYCDDGRFEVIDNDCSQATCEEGERVTWADVEEGEARICQGEVTASGIAVASDNGERVHYTDIATARAQSKILFGTATFSCRNGKWQRNVAGSFCRYKTTSEKSCVSSGNNNAYCQ